MKLEDIKNRHDFEVYVEENKTRNPYTVFLKQASESDLVNVEFNNSDWQKTAKEIVAPCFAWKNDLISELVRFMNNQSIAQEQAIILIEGFKKFSYVKVLELSGIALAAYRKLAETAYPEYTDKRFYQAITFVYISEK